MELQIESRNTGMRTSWQNKIEKEKERLVRHHPGMIHYLRVSFEGTPHHKEGGLELRLVATVPNETVVVKKKGEGGGPLLVEAFDVLELQLRKIQCKRRQKTKMLDREH